MEPITNNKQAVAIEASVWLCAPWEEQVQGRPSGSKKTISQGESRGWLHMLFLLQFFLGEDDTRMF